MKRKLDARLKGRRILLLQGPLGPFFYNLAQDLRASGAVVLKVNFNGGDWLFYPTQCLFYRKPMEEWPAFFEHMVGFEEIDTVIIFGDCRPIHRAILGVVERLGLKLLVFEEGYVRPDYVTLEQNGVNGRSELPKDPKFYQTRILRRLKQPLKVGSSFYNAMAYAMMYHGASRLAWMGFRHYKHHRPLTILEGLRWIRAGLRKIKFERLEKGVLSMLCEKFSRRFYLVPLQVHNDAQITEHSAYSSSEEFIAEIIESFSGNAPEETLLVLKHHPLDRGYRDYTLYIRDLALQHGVSDRVHYIHDLHLPTLLKNARGVVLINSTVGISALQRGIRVKACGKAIYNFAGLTFQGELDDFWRDTSPFFDIRLFEKFRSFLIEQTQINGNFYNKIPNSPSACGMSNWIGVMLKALGR